MDLFICSTAYQLYNAICVANKMKTKPDLIVIRYSIIENCNLQNLMECNIFSNIFIWTELFDKVTDANVQNRIDKYKRYGKLLLSIIQKRKILGTLPNKSKIYERIFIGYADFVNQYIWSCFKDKSITCLYDEGTYTYGCLNIQLSLLKRMIQKIIFRGSLLQDVSEVYVRDKERFSVGNHKSIYVKKIDFDMSRNLEDIIYTTFKIHPSTIKILDKPAIVFDHNIELEDVRNKQLEIVEECCKLIGRNNVIVKLHPASVKASYKDFCDQYEDRIPFEIVMNSLDMDNKVLISIFSTACFSPKQYLNKEPFIILTYKLMGTSFLLDTQYLDIVTQIKNDYIHSNRVFIPQTMNELIDVLKYIQVQLSLNI